MDLTLISITLILCSYSVLNLFGVNVILLQPARMTLLILSTLQPLKPIDFEPLSNEICSHVVYAFIAV